MSDRLGRLLTHPLRHRLLFEYAGEAANPAAVARRLGEPVNLVSYHTQVLLKHDFIRLVRTERRRGVLTRWYAATVTAAIEDADWGALPVSVRRALITGTLAQVAEEARRAALEGGFDGPHVQLTRSPLDLDAEGVLETTERLRSAFTEIAAIVAASSPLDAPDRTPYQLAMLGYERPRDSP
jgi:hypothetical protein